MQAQLGGRVVEGVVGVVPQVELGTVGQLVVEGNGVHVTVDQVDEIVLLVNESWRGARQIYVATGFEEISRLPGFFGPAGAGAEDGIVMRRPLS